MSLWGRTVFFILIGLLLTPACSKKKNTPAPSNNPSTPNKPQPGQSLDQSLKKLSDELAETRAELNRLKSDREALISDLKAQAEKLKVLAVQDAAAKVQLEELNRQIANLEQMSSAQLEAIKQALAKRIAELEAKLEEKRSGQTISIKNSQKLLQNLMEGHTGVYRLHGLYKIMVIPVQFSDKSFENVDYIKQGLHGDLFDPQNKKSLRAYYRHASLGKFDVDGLVVDPVTVSGTLEDYGKALPGTNDQNARGLVVEALKLVKQKQTDPQWWAEFDRWDLHDYDGDEHYNEPDGFIDAVVLIYAGKSQAGCQRSFDPEGKSPGSDDVPPGPRRDSAVECFNRIWPHRWAISLSADDPDYSAKGPVIEGVERPSLNGLKINDRLFAFDYNMQSEFSDLSTVMHEFGHSLTLPDIYARQGENSVGAWELMASNADNQAQELSSYSKLSLGWILPKILPHGKSTSAYLGAYNFVPEKQRNQMDLGGYNGPSEVMDGNHAVSLLSKTPDYNESVYRSLLVTTPPSVETIQVTEPPEAMGSTSAYTSRYDGTERSWSKKLKVPADGEAKLTFDTIYHIETETNFNSKEETIKVVTDYDMGEIKVNDKVIESLRLISGDNDHDTLNESNPACEFARVLEIRKKINAGEASAEEKKEFSEKTRICQQPVWIKKTVDLSPYRGQTVDFKIAYRTDAGYTEFGIVFDNVKFGDEIEDFENAGDKIGEFVALKNGAYQQEFNQFYLMEYRTPGISYESEGHELSYNMDNHIDVGSQSIFLPGEEPLPQRFRMMEFNYQPGVVVWYFNSKYDTNSNSPTAAEQQGKGYLLVLNSKVQELPIPGPLSNHLFFENGVYKDPKKDAALGSFVKEQNRLFACFGYTRYYKYLTGENADCSGFQNNWIDYLVNLTWDSRKLIFRREGFNDVLPKDRYANWGVGTPFTRSPYIRTGLSAFRPAGSGAAMPFKVYKEENGQMALDRELTSSQMPIPAVDSFSDAENSLPPKGFIEDSVVVEKVGFNFKVVEPAAGHISGYSESPSADANAHAFRRPLVKILIDWK